MEGASHGQYLLPHQSSLGATSARGDVPVCLVVKRGEAMVLVSEAAVLAPEVTVLVSEAMVLVPEVTVLASKTSEQASDAVSEVTVLALMSEATVQASEATVMASEMSALASETSALASDSSVLASEKTAPASASTALASQAPASEASEERRQLPQRLKHANPHLSSDSVKADAPAAGYGVSSALTAPATSKMLVESLPTRQSSFSSAFGC